MCVPPLGDMLASVPISDGDRLRLWGLSKPVAISRVWLRDTLPDNSTIQLSHTVALPAGTGDSQDTHRGASSSLCLEP